MSNTQTIDFDAICERHLARVNRRNRVVRTIVGGVLGGFLGLVAGASISTPARAAPPSFPDLSSCLMGVGTVAYAEVKAAGFPTAKPTIFPAMVRIDRDLSTSGSFQTMEITCNEGKPIIGIYFTGDEPSTNDKALAIRFARGVFRPWFTASSEKRLPALVESCLAARPKEYNVGGIRDGLKVTANTIEAWCDVYKWDKDNPTSPMSSKFSFAVALTP